MRYISAPIACIMFACAFNASAAEPEAPKADTQPYVILHLKDCSLPVCEEQVVYLQEDNRLKLLSPKVGDSPVAGPRESWADARPGAFQRVSLLVRALAEGLPGEGDCQKVQPERISVTGRLVQAEDSVSFEFSDACANQSSGSMPYQLVRELREALTLGVQPLIEG